MTDTFPSTSSPTTSIAGSTRTTLAHLPQQVLVVSGAGGAGGDGTGRNATVVQLDAAQAQHFITLQVEAPSGNGGSVNGESGGNGDGAVDGYFVAAPTHSSAPSTEVGTREYSVVSASGTPTLVPATFVYCQPVSQSNGTSGGNQHETYAQAATQQYYTSVSYDQMTNGSGGSTSGTAGAITLPAAVVATTPGGATYHLQLHQSATADSAGATQVHIIQDSGNATNGIDATATQATVKAPSGGEVTTNIQLVSQYEAAPNSDANVTNIPSSEEPIMSAQQVAASNSIRDMDIIHVQWLIDNYETAEGVSLPRSTLYNHYIRHCKEHDLDPVNAASFGKLIRSVFLGLRTRRLGTRGNSKYHYYGIRVKPNSPLVNLLDDVDEDEMEPIPTTRAAVAPKQPATAAHKRGGGGRASAPTSAPRTGRPRSPDDDQLDDDEQADRKSPTAADTSNTTGSAATPQGGATIISANVTANHRQFLGDASVAIPQLCLVMQRDDSLLTENDAYEFSLMYKKHCKDFLDAIVELQFCQVETIWSDFFVATVGDKDDMREVQRRRRRLEQMLSSTSVVAFVRHTDTAFYQNLVDVLIPDVLRPIPSSLTQAIRNFAKNLESWLTSAMAGFPKEIYRVKMAAATAFAQTLRRYTSLNHLAQAARAVLHNAAQIQQMLSDLNRVDFHNVQEQASWVCECDDALVISLEMDFKRTLEQQSTLEQWANWLDSVVDRVLEHTANSAAATHSPNPSAVLAKLARQFLLKWSFYSSMVIRDLTLRSAASFGSFHLIRLLYDEYMFYLVEHRVAKAVGKTPIALMAEMVLNPDRADVECSLQQQQQQATTSLLQVSNLGDGSQTLAPPSTPYTIVTVSANGSPTGESEAGWTVDTPETPASCLEVQIPTSHTTNTLSPSPPKKVKVLATAAS